MAQTPPEGMTVWQSRRNPETGKLEYRWAVFDGDNLHVLSRSIMEPLRWSEWQSRFYPVGAQPPD